MALVLVECAEVAATTAAVAEIVASCRRVAEVDFQAVVDTR